MAAGPVLEMRGITKRFPGVLANDHVDFDLQRGEVHALLGENGAGKSTLMSILYGLYHPDEGQIFLNGKEVSIDSPRAAIDLGIGMVHQHFMLIPVMTVTENIVLGIEPHHVGVFLDQAAARERVLELSKSFGLAVDPDARIDKITVGQQQRVEIIKALYRKAEILILDEPTAVLTPQEATELFGILEMLKREGLSIIFISHKLNEVLEIADRITVLRRGKMIETLPAAGTTEQELARRMVGREVLLRVDKTPATPGETILEVEDLHALDDRGLEAVRGVSFAVHAGEIVGIAGVDGNGQTQLIEALTGLRGPRAGVSRSRGETSPARRPTGSSTRESGTSPRTARSVGSYSSSASPRTSRCTTSTGRRTPASGGYDPGRLLARAVKLVKEFDVRGGGPRTPAGSLSGGNQQKVVVAREVDGDPRVLIAAQPTRGLDVGAIEFVHRRLVEERDEGRAVLLVSLELDEILSLSDRILVMYEGRIVGEYTPDVTEEELGFAMLGGTTEEVAA